ncbi:UNVERIFIED_CONTAM: hypothetical protein GTU68_052022, partial [Idotea baltica]|nr:hypothetical protein [Idotea baltica]
MLLSIAIVDDIGAILVIAIGYTESLNLGALGIGIAGILLVSVSARMGIRSIPIYGFLGVGIWYAFHESGIHATLAGVILGLQTPAKSWEAVSPLLRLETMLHPWVGFVIMPIFAFANAGVVFSTDAITTSVSLAVVGGLVIGKPVGIVLFSWLVVRSGKAKLPENVTWPMLIGGGCLTGIGFTMALFIADLA